MSCRDILLDVEMSVEGLKKELDAFLSGKTKRSSTTARNHALDIKKACIELRKEISIVAKRMKEEAAAKPSEDKVAEQPDMKEHVEAVVTEAGLRRPHHVSAGLGMFVVTQVMTRHIGTDGLRGERVVKHRAIRQRSVNRDQPLDALIQHRGVRRH